MPPKKKANNNKAAATSASGGGDDGGEGDGGFVGGGGVGGDTIEATYGPVDPWVKSSIQILKILDKHSYVNMSNKKALANFYIPSADGHNVNLITVLEGLLNNTLDTESFSKQTIGVFQSVVDKLQLSPQQEYMKKLVDGCRHLARYVTWLCLENLPLTEDSSNPATGTNTSSEAPAPPQRTSQKIQSLLLRTSRRDQERLVREKILENTPIEPTTSASACRKLLKDLERCRNKKEMTQLSFFVTPVNDTLLADYSVYVRRPMDLGTVKAKLELTCSSSSSSSSSSIYSSTSALAATNKSITKYASHGEFIADLRRVFSNAIKYNGAHLASDTTGASQMVYDAAALLASRLEALWSSATITLADRVETMAIEREELDKRESHLKSQELILEQTAREFERSAQERLKATDQVYAHDLDASAKRKEIRQQLSGNNSSNNIGHGHLLETPMAPLVTPSTSFSSTTATVVPTKVTTTATVTTTSATTTPSLSIPAIRSIATTTPSTTVATTATPAPSLKIKMRDNSISNAEEEATERLFLDQHLQATNNSNGNNGSHILGINGNSNNMSNNKIPLPSNISKRFAAQFNAKCDVQALAWATLSARFTTPAFVAGVDDAVGHSNGGGMDGSVEGSINNNNNKKDEKQSGRRRSHSITAASENQSNNVATSELTISGMENTNNNINNNSNNNTNRIVSFSLKRPRKLHAILPCDEAIIS